MANRKKYIRSNSGYIFKSLHQLTPDGNIYERDQMTINEMPMFAPGQIPVYNDSNFIFTVRKGVKGRYNVTNNSWLKSTDDDFFWTSEDLGVIDKTTTDASYIKPYYSSLTDFAYYGSAYELIRSTVNTIIKTFPAGIYITEKQFSNFFDEDDKIVTFLEGKYLVKNPFGLDICSQSVGNVENPYKYFCLTNTDYEINGKPITWVPSSGITGCPKNGDTLKSATIKGNGININIYYIFVDGREIICADKGPGTLIRPKKDVIDAFFKGLSEFGKVLLNRDTNPLYKSYFEAYFESDGALKRQRKEFIWPLDDDGHNLDITSNRFKDYLQELGSMASFYDEYWSDNFYRAMAHESVKNLDWTFARFSQDETIDTDDLDFSRMQMMMRIYGRQLDELKRYIDGIGFSNNVSYNQVNNQTDYTLSDSLELAGWEVKNLFTKDDGQKSDVLYTGESVGYTMTEANNEFFRRLKLNSPYIFAQKGTKQGIKTLLSLFGMEKDSHYILRDFVYNANNTLDEEVVKKYNLAKTSFNVTYQSEYGDLSGIPVKKIGDTLVPWFDKDKKYDTDIYFEMAGGWDGRSTKTVRDIDGKDFDLPPVAGKYYYNETQKYVKYVNDISELLSLPIDFIKNEDFVYVNNISGLDPTVANNASHYFYIHNVYFSNFIDYNWKEGDELSALEGWYSIPKSSVISDTTTNLGEKLLLYLSYKEETLGNNPHFGNKKYDGGESWKEAFNSIFKGSIENLGAFIGVEDVKEEEAAKLGFDIALEEAKETKTVIVTDEVEAAKTINSKVFEITFITGTYNKEFIEEYVLCYLKQIIPSTTILKIEYKPQDTVYGITIDNR